MEFHAAVFLVLHAGRILTEYCSHSDAGSRHILFPVSKSVTGALAGVLVVDGGRDPDCSVIRYVPEAAWSAYRDCTVRHVLDVSVALRFVEDFVDPRGSSPATVPPWNGIPPNPASPSEDIHSFIAGFPKDNWRHGERFHDVSPNSSLLS